MCATNVTSDHGSSYDKAPTRRGTRAVRPIRAVAAAEAAAGRPGRDRHRGKRSEKYETESSALGGKTES